MENDNQIIIDLLREQNQTLHKLLEFHQHQEKVAFRNAVIHFIIQAIPFIAILIIGYFLYMGLKTYLDAINTNIQTIQEGYTSIQNSMQGMITKISSIPGEISAAVKNLNPFQ